MEEVKIVAFQNKFDAIIKTSETFIKGPQGEKGDKGDKGETGETGPQGIQGEKGDPFTYADFTAEQLENLKGPKGDTGNSGVYIGNDEPSDENIRVWIDEECEEITYEKLPNKPKINGVELIGNKTSEELGITGAGGENGATFIPNVDINGNLSWTNNKGLDNPETVNIKGPQGEKGDTGQKGVQGIPGNDGYTPLKGVDYFTQEDIANLNIPTKNSDLINDKNFISSNNITNIVIVTEYPEKMDANTLYLKSEV